MPLRDHRRSVRLLTGIFCLSCCLASGNASDKTDTVAGIDFFEKKIRPVLVEHCYECHAADSKVIRGGLRVDHAAALRQGGDSGPAVVPNDIDSGTLLDALRYETFEMPPQQKLPPAVIQDFEKWIAMGAPDPRTGDVAAREMQEGIDLEQGREFWSFRPLQWTPAPNVKQTSWPRTEIDSFILARQENAGLIPGPDAEALTLLRRLYFDLTGLPPTYEQIQKFQAAAPETRFERTVDELLSSPRFGERWGRHWLDLARYADSTGGGRSLLYGESWRYRNYVIESFNRDVPFDQFIREQIAGDLLHSDDYRERQRQITATAFLILGPHNYEAQDKELLRMDVVDEQIDTIGRVFLGMTIGCARCHDHKFDPIPTTDYYALAGIFRSTDSLVEGNVSRWESTPLPMSPVQKAEAETEARKIAEKKEAIQKLKTKIDSLKIGLPSIVVDNDAAKLVGEWTESQSISGYLGSNYQHSSQPEHSATYQITTEPGTYDVEFSYTPAANRTRQAKVVVHHAKGETEFLVNQKLTPNVNGVFHSLGQFAAGESLTIVIQPTENAPTIIDAVRLISRTAEQDDSAQQIKAELAAAQKKLAQLEQQVKAYSPPKVPQLVSVKEMEQAEDYHVCIRGNVHNLGDPVKRGFLSVVEGPQVAPITSASSGRLQLADWLASEQNPLTARVFVNRVWHHLFGVGLVRTVDNFGAPGEVPSHPELLDHLASEFMNRGWSVKTLIRNIVLSRTYQLSSHVSAASTQDAENRLLTHQNRKRLTAESIHDALLQFSGQLQESPVDDPVRPGTKSEYDYNFEFGPRAIYQPVFRNRLPDVLTVFDFPNPNLSQGRRTSSTISPQALFFMNSPFAENAAAGTTQRVLAIDGILEERLEWLTLTILNRYPLSDESRLFHAYLEEDPQNAGHWEHIAQALFASLDFRFVR